MDTKPNTRQALEQLQMEVENKLAPLGYEVVALEHAVSSKEGGRKVTLYIDFLNNESQSRRIGLDDCVTVNQAIDELFETTRLLEGHYNLEVSSPGIERPLRKAEDFKRFSGKKARLHVFRPLEKEETENESYWENHKKQKNFVGLLAGIISGKEPGTYKVKMTVDGQQVTVPSELISKAHLEADFTTIGAKK